MPGTVGSRLHPTLPLRCAAQDMRLRYLAYEVDSTAPAATPGAVRDGLRVLDAGCSRDARQINWTLDRWGVAQVLATGYASTVGSRRLNRSLAVARAHNVADYLRVNGIETLATGEFRRQGQDAIERLCGLSRFHRVDIALRPLESAVTRGTAAAPSTEMQHSPARDAGAATTSTSSQ